MIRILLLFFVLLASQARSQFNLVINPSFEQLDSCPGFYLGSGSLQYCSYWFTPFSLPFPGGGGSTELFTPCSTEPLMSVPNNGWGYQQPYADSNYAGFWLLGGGGREYIEGTLTDTLKAGKKYCVSFWYSYADSTPAITNNLELVFTNDSLMVPEDSMGLILHLTPDLIADTNTLIIDTMNWLLFEREYVARGGEKYFTIGNFQNNNENNVQVVIPGTSFPNGCYIYVDDFEVFDCDSPDAVTETPWWKPTFSLYPNPADAFVWYEWNGLSNDAVIRVVDVLGRAVYEQPIAKSEGSTSIDTRGMSGFYVVKCFVGNTVVDKRHLVVTP